MVFHQRQSTANHPFLEKEERSLYQNKHEYIATGPTICRLPHKCGLKNKHFHLQLMVMPSSTLCFFGSFTWNVPLLGITDSIKKYLKC